MSKIKLLTVLFASCVMLTQGHAFLGKALKKDAKSEEGKSRVELAEYTGVKHALAVVGFENPQNWRAQIELGGGLAMMLESALSESGRLKIPCA